MRSWLRRSMIVLAVPLAVGAAVPPAAHADDTTLTIAVAPTATLLDPTLVRVPVRITCAPITVGSDQGSAQLRQSVPSGIAFGQGFREQAIVCDGRAHANSYLIWIDTGSPGGFAPGNATVQVSEFLCPPPPTSTTSCDSGGSGIQVIRLQPGRRVTVR